MLPLSHDDSPTISSSNSRIGGPRSSFKRSSNTKGYLFRSCYIMPEYFHRIFDYRQMDWKATFYQMIMLLINPSKVYKSAYYRKQTKNRWARDDPAFAVIQVWFLFISAIAWAIAFHVPRFGSYVWLIFQAIVIEWLGLGVLVATGSWWVANNYLRLQDDSSAADTFFVEQSVEWQYAFDIHCNAYFIMFLFIDVMQFFIAPLLLGSSFSALLVANTLYCLGYGLYVYISFLGYMALPFLQHTERFLYPLIVIGGLYLASLVVKVAFGATFNCAVMSGAYYYQYALTV